MKKHLSLIALACTLALALSVVGRAEEKTKKDDKSDTAKEPMYSASCPSPCKFSVKSHDKAEIAAILKAHAKSHHQMDMSDKDAAGMIKGGEAKKS